MIEQRTVTIPYPGRRGGHVEIGNELPLVLIAGPCVIENEEHALRTATRLREITEEEGVRFVYKSSWDKANRTSADAHRGPGMEEGLRVLERVREVVGCPVTTDVHEPGQCGTVAEVVDLLQVPAFLCRQTDLLRAAAAAGRPVNVKRGQFLAPWDAEHVVGKLRSARPRGPVLLTERGTTFGHGDLVVDLRAIETMKRTGCPVVFDATHSVQRPGAGGGSTGGSREFIAPLARAAVAVGVAALFLEVHEDPDRAPCDGPCMLPLDELPDLLFGLVEHDAIRKRVFET